MNTPRRITPLPACLLIAASLVLCAGYHTFAQGMVGPAGAAAPGPQVAAKPPPPPPPTFIVSFKDGRSVSATSFRRLGADIVATVDTNGQMSEFTYPIGSIDRINFPEPAQIDSSTQLVLDGKFDEAIAKIEPTIGYYQAFKDVPGNWWAQAARVKLKALQYLHRDTAANALISEMVSSAPANSEAARLAGVLQASIVARDGHPDKALPVFESAITSSTDDETLGYAWAYKGASLYALQQFEPAVLAYLHVPVFYPDTRLLLPEILLGCGKSFVHIEHLPYAENSFNDVITQFPSSPEAVAAKAELKRIAKTPEATANPSPTPSPDSNTSNTSNTNNSSTPASSPGGSAAPAADASPAAQPSNP